MIIFSGNLFKSCQIEIIILIFKEKRHKNFLDGPKHFTLITKGLRFKRFFNTFKICFPQAMANTHVITCND